MIVIVRHDDFDVLFLPGPRLGSIAYDAAHLLPMLKKSVCDCSAYISRDSHDCEH